MLEVDVETEADLLLTNTCPIKKLKKGSLRSSSSPEEHQSAHENEVKIR
jgi:hypothetical protein